MRAEIAALRQEVRALRQEIADGRMVSGHSMRKHGRCPRCGHADLLHVSRIYDHSLGDYMKVHSEGLFRGRPTGTFEVYACRQCEFAEWYVVGAGEMDPKKLGHLNRDHVRIIRSDPPGDGPFR
jgi:predicted nucleic-acid-binding Zn-ribbon protein